MALRFHVMLGITAKHRQSSCQLFLVNNVSNIQPLVKLLGSGIGSLPTTYLRLPSGAILLPSPYRKESWKMQEEIIEPEKTRFLLRGSLVLINNVLEVLSTYT